MKVYIIQTVDIKSCEIPVESVELNGKIRQVRAVSDGKEVYGFIAADNPTEMLFEALDQTINRQS